MPYTTEAKNRMLDALARGEAPVAAITHMSLHTASPGPTGANEVTGGSPAYARQAITWDAAASSEIHEDVVAPFDVPAATVTHAGFWSGTDFMAYDDLPEPQVFADQGTYTVTSAVLDLLLA